MNNQTPSVPTEEVVDMSPFKRMVMTIGTLPNAFTESLTYYEALAYFVKYLEETVVPAVNQNAEATKELQTLFTELKNYVDTYFDNLDVQEEINNKLDEMAESGELEAILQQILNTLRVYDTVLEMIADTSIQNGQRVMTLGYSVVDDNGGGVFTITNTTQTPNGLTIIELDNGLYALKEYSDKIVVTDQSLLTTAVLTELLNNSVEIITDNPIEVTETIEITTDGAKIHGMEFIGNQSASDQYILFVRSNNVCIDHCKFTGTMANYIRATNDCYGLSITNNIIDGTDGNTVSPVVLWTANNFKITNNTLRNNRGFNIQCIKCVDGVISNNVIKNNHYAGSYTANGGEINVQFNTNGIYPARQALIKNNSFTNGYTTNYNADTGIITLTLNSVLQAGDVLKFRCYASLECIQINSHCHHIVIEGNSIDGSGDSGIVVGRDYHQGSLNPSSTNNADSSRRININGNTITNCAYAGIAFTAAPFQVSANNNNISNCGWLTDGIYSCGIFIPFTYIHFGNEFCNNVICNSSSTDEWYETENGITKYGITLNPASTIDGVDGYLKSTGKIKIYGNTSWNISKLYNFYAMSNTTCQCGIQFTPLSIADFGIRDDTTTNAAGNYGQITANAGGVSATTENSVPVINIDFNESGDRYASLNLQKIKLINNGNLKISFYAKSDVENEGKFRLIYIGNGVTKNADLVLTNSWKHYEFSILISPNTNRNVIMRFVPSGACRNIRFSNFEVKSEEF